MSATMTSSANWRDAWFQDTATVYLNAAGQAPMPRVALEAVQAALEWKKFPYVLTDHAELDLPGSVRESIASLIGAQPGEIALTTGASAGLIALAYGIDWKRDDQILTAYREFPLEYTTWRPMEAREGVTLRVIAPRGQWITAEDFIAQLTPRTRLVSVSLVRFDDGSMLDAPKLGEACHAQGTLLALDVSQCCGGIPMDVRKLGADFLICSGYKWLLGPYGTGFFWATRELLASFRPSPFYWQGIEGLKDYSDLIHEHPKAAQSGRPWDAAETASYFNLAGWNASLSFLRQVETETVAKHNQNLIGQLREGLPREVCVWTSPVEPERRGPYGCFAGRSLAETQEMYAHMKEARIFASLREGNIRVSTHLYNTEEDIEKVIRVIGQ
jgi:cysteine desulfurase / selenocysteine lyase